MLRVLPFVLFLGVWLFALIDCVLTPERDVRNLPKIAWIAIIVITFVIGAVCWLFLGRPAQRLRPGSPARRPTTGSTGARPPTSRPAGPLGPDDDPEFLRKLRRGNEEHERMLREWEQHLKDQEQEQRRKRARKQEREDGRNGDGNSQPTAPDGSDGSDGADGSES